MFLEKCFTVRHRRFYTDCWCILDHFCGKLLQYCITDDQSLMNIVICHPDYVLISEYFNIMFVNLVILGKI
jgi:hypothetical protein